MDISASFLLLSTMGNVSIPVDADIHSHVPCTSEIVADSPIRLGLHPHLRSMVSRQHRSCNPLLEPENACTSSITMKRRLPKISVNMSSWSTIRFCSDSGVICNIPLAFFNELIFLLWPTSPCHSATGISVSLMIGSILSN